MTEVYAAVGGAMDRAAIQAAHGRHDGGVELRLDERDRAMLAGEHGEATRLAMRIVCATAEAGGAEHLIDISSAHIDSCLYHGPLGVDFAERLAGGGGHVRVPTTLNVSALDLLHPDLVRLPEPARRAARAQMLAYERMGCRPTWTCAPYQLPGRPAFGEHVAWAESNAIVFANSVLGARTERYGDFIDICAALTGRVGATGLHLDANRRGRVLFRLRGLPDQALGEEAFFCLLGLVIGSETGNDVPVVQGLDRPATEDQLKALGAAAASSGAVALVHVIGTTPEAATVRDACGPGGARRTVEVTPQTLAAAAAKLTSTEDGSVTAVSLGTPHLSLDGFKRLTPMLAASRIHPDVIVYVSTGRDVLREVEARGWLPAYERPGVQLVVDTCTYITPVIDGTGIVMTDSAKWAWYAPANLGVDVVFARTEDCLRSAASGRVERELNWLGA